MADLFGFIIGSLFNIVIFISHLIIVLFRNAVLLAFAGAFFYGIFRLGQYAWRWLRGSRAMPAHTEPAPDDVTKNRRE